MDFRNVGGTPGGTKTFLFGLIMAIAGGYLLLSQVTVHGGYWHWAGAYGRSFGLTLIPLLFGIGILFFNGKSVIGWVLTGGGALLIVVGVIANMDIHFRQTSLFNTILILVLLVGGIGLIVRSVMPMTADGKPGGKDEPPTS